MREISNIEKAPQGLFDLEKKRKNGYFVMRYRVDCPGGA